MRRRADHLSRTRRPFRPVRRGSGGTGRGAREDIPDHAAPRDRLPGRSHRRSEGGCRLRAALARIPSRPRDLHRRRLRQRSADRPGLRRCGTRSRTPARLPRNRSSRRRHGHLHLRIDGQPQRHSARARRVHPGDRRGAPDFLRSRRHRAERHSVQLRHLDGRYLRAAVGGRNHLHPLGGGAQGYRGGGPQHRRIRDHGHGDEPPAAQAASRQAEHASCRLLRWRAAFGRVPRARNHLQRVRALGAVERGDRF